MSDSEFLLGADMSYDDLTDAKAEELKAAGVEVLGQCLWDGIQQPEHRVTNLRTATAHGLYVYGYGALTRVGSGLEHAWSSRTGVPDDLWAQLLFCEADVELAGVTPMQVRDMVETFAHYGSRRVIYTSDSKWDELGGPLTFTDCLLHDANYDGRSVLDYPRLYGGWTLASVIGKQYNDLGVGDVVVDQDIFSRALLIGDDMTPDQVNALIEQKITTEVYPKIGALLTNAGSLGATGVQQGEAIKALGDAIINHIQTHPGGGASITMLAEIQDIQTRVAAIDQTTTDLKAKIAAIGAAASATV